MKTTLLFLFLSLLATEVSAQKIVEAKPVDSIYVFWDAAQDMTYWRTGKILLHYDKAEDNLSEVFLYAYEKGKHTDQPRPSVEPKVVSILLRYRWSHSAPCTSVKSWQLKFTTADNPAFVPSSGVKLTYKAYNKKDSVFVSPDKKDYGHVQIVWASIPLPEFLNAAAGSANLMFHVNDCSSTPVDDPAYVRTCILKFGDHISGKKDLVLVQAGL